MAQIKISSLLVLVLVMAGLSGCSSLWQDPHQDSNMLTTKQKEELIYILDNYQEHEALIAQWKSSQGSINRLLAIENELKMLIEQLNNFETESKVDESQAAENLEQKDPQPKVDTLPVDSRFPKNTAESQGDYTQFFAVQLAALSSVKNLSNIWQQLSRQHSNLLGNLSANVEVVESPNGKFYRLKVGEFNSSNEAVILCDKLKTLSVNCMVNRYITLPVSLSEFNLE
jgi:hypothetical protein